MPRPVIEKYANTEIHRAYSSERLLFLYVDFINEEITFKEMGVGTEIKQELGPSDGINFALDEILHKHAALDEKST